MATGLVHSNDFLHHVTAPGHPERPARLTAIVATLREGGLMDRLVQIAPQPAAEEDLLVVHEPAYLRRTEEACRRGDETIDCPDSSICTESFNVAKLAAGTGIAAVDAVMAGRVETPSAAVRPPGHHAERDRSMGFCLFNNVAIAAPAPRRHGVERVLILDWDVHHGNGTQDIFYDDPSVFFICSTNTRCHPGHRLRIERGIGAGRGATLNVPLPDRHRRRRLPPRVQDSSCRPRGVRAGVRAYLRRLRRPRPRPARRTGADRARFRPPDREVKQLAPTLPRALVAMLEGGYDLTALAANVRGTIEAFLE